MPENVRDPGSGRYTYRDPNALLRQILAKRGSELIVRSAPEVEPAPADELLRAIIASPAVRSADVMAALDKRASTPEPQPVTPTAGDLTQLLRDALYGANAEEATN